MINRVHRRRPEAHELEVFKDHSNIQLRRHNLNQSEFYLKSSHCVSHRSIRDGVDVHRPRARVALAVGAADLRGVDGVLHHAHALVHQPGKVPWAKWAWEEDNTINHGHS